MATNNKESGWEKTVEFFTQHKDDRAYEKAGGDGRVPVEKRQGEPRREARVYALSIGEGDPYPEDGPLQVDVEVSEGSTEEN